VIHWNASPLLLEIGPLSLRWYGLLFAGGFIVGHAVTARYFAHEKKSLVLVDQLLLYVAIGTIVGARLGHTLFYEPDVYLQQPWRIPMVWEGGLASHGAAVGIFLAIYLYFRRHRELGLLWVFDRAAPAVAIAGVFIRTGNLFNSEILGKKADVPWAFVFQRVDSVPRHPAMMYEAAAYLVIYLVLNRLYWKKSVRQAKGMLFGLFLITVFGARFLLEFFKEAQVAFEEGMALNMGQLLSIPLIALGLWLVLRARRFEKKYSR
jgi:phosphatidylglycerol:prolipoprotein diacylglycerol transferase